MKKKYGVLIVAGMVAVLCIGCSNGGTDVNNEVKDTETNTEISTELESEGTELTETTDEVESILYADLSRDNLVDDEDMVKNALNLVKDENAFTIKLDTECPEGDEVYEINGLSYKLIPDVSGWADYEAMAVNYYAQSYIDETFTPFYTTVTGTFVEQDGKLYRALSDGVGVLVIDETIELWQAEDGFYYITIQYDSDMEGDTRGFIVRVAEDKTYGFEIVDKVSVY